MSHQLIVRSDPSTTSPLLSYVQVWRCRRMSNDQNATHHSVCELVALRDRCQTSKVAQTTASLQSGLNPPRLPPPLMHFWSILAPSDFPQCQQQKNKNSCWIVKTFHIKKVRVFLMKTSPAEGWRRLHPKNKAYASFGV